MATPIVGRAAVGLVWAGLPLFFTVDSCQPRNVDAGGRLPVENELRKRLAVLGAEARAAVLRVLSLPDEKRAAAIGTLYADLRLRPLAELMIDLEASPGVRAVLVTELREIEHRED